MKIGWPNLLAIERVKQKAKQHNLTDEQKSQLRERESTERAAAESALLKLYTEVWLPKLDNGGIAIEQVAVGGRPLQTTLNDKKEARIHERVMELLTQVQKRVFDTVTPGKIVEFFKLGETSSAMGIRTGDIVNGFYSFLGFTRLVSEGVVAKAIATGVEKRLFGYVSGGAPNLGEDGKYRVAPGKVRFDTTIALDEIDLESGFVMMPAAIPQPATTTGPGQGTQTPEPSGATPTDSGPTASQGGQTKPPSVSEPVSVHKHVDLCFTADRDKIFNAWNAIANLAEMAGSVTVTIHAEAEEGFDQSKLQNGVLEPLREADLME